MASNTLGWTGHAGYISSMGYAPDVTRVVTGSSDKMIQIWDAESSAVVGKHLTGHNRRVNSVAYSPDEQHIISGSDGCTIRIWNAKTGASVSSPLNGHTDLVCSVALLTGGASSPDPETAEVSTEDGKLREGHTYPVRSLDYSSDVHAISCLFAKPDMDGWVRAQIEGGLLYWVPHDCRTGLHLPALLTIPLTSHHRSISLDFDDFAFGTSIMDSNVQKCTFLAFLSMNSSDVAWHLLLFRLLRFQLLLLLIEA